MSEALGNLPGAHLAIPEDESSAGESILKVIQRMFVKSFAWIGIYLLGYYDFSIAWLVTPLFLTALRTQWKRERDAKLGAARHAALTNEKEMIESRIRVEDLPSWVFFPDKERAEWVNAIIQQLWPNVGHYTRKLIAESIEPAVKSALEGYSLKGFKFERVILGQIPPRITGIKVYDKNISRNEIIMDLDLVFASDCDIKFSLGKIKAKIMDFSLRGLVRVVFKPLVNEIPLIGGVQAYFLNAPDIDFDLGGIANAFDAPGLSNIIRKIVLEQIGYFMVLPHKFTMPLVDSVENKMLKCPDSAGVLRVRLHKAVQLEKKDIGVLGMGKSDPYAVLSVGARTVKTKRIDNTLNPEWNFVADFPIEVVRGQELSLEVMDHDDPGEDEFLGRATVQTSVVAAKGEISNMWVELEDVATGRALVSLSWLETTIDRSMLDRPVAAGDATLSRCLLHVYVDCCKDLVVSRSSAQRPSPRVELRVGQESQTTFPQYHNPDPVFEQGFVFLVVHPDSDDLHIKIVDVGHADRVIGTAVIRVSHIVNEQRMELANQPFQLQGGSPSSTITLSANVRCLLPPKIKHSAEVSKSSSLDSTKSVDKQKSVDKPDKNPPTSTGLAEPMPKLAGIMKQSDVDASGDKADAKVNEIVSTTPTVNPAIVDVGGVTSINGEPVAMFDPLNEIRKRGHTSPCGKIKLSLAYDQDKHNLRVTVHQATGLPGSDLPDPPDPYVKMYLLPERNKKSKRKTDVVKDTTEPVFDEVFNYDIEFRKLGLWKLEVTVVDKKGIFNKSPLMGQAIVDLNNPNLLNLGITDWFPLVEATGDSDD